MSTVLHHIVYLSVFCLHKLSRLTSKQHAPTTTPQSCHIWTLTIRDYIQLKPPPPRSQLHNKTTHDVVNSLVPNGPNSTNVQSMVTSISNFIVSFIHHSILYICSQSQQTQIESTEYYTRTFNDLRKTSKRHIVVSVYVFVWICVGMCKASGSW